MNKLLKHYVHFFLIGFMVFGLQNCTEDEEPTPDGGDTENSAPTVSTSIDDITVEEGFGTKEIDIAEVFADSDGDDLSISATSSDDAVVTLTSSGTSLILTEQGIGSSTITVTAEDGNEGAVSDAFQITVTAKSVTSTEIFTFDQSEDNELSISSWIAVDGADGYIVVINDENSFSNLTDGENLPASSTYIGYGAQRVYSGSAVGSVNISLLEAEKTYYFKVYSYSGTYVYDNSLDAEEATTSTCAISSTTESQVCFSISGDVRTISSNQYPSHAVGNFPNADPTAIESTHDFDLTPEKAASVTYVYDETGGPTPMNQNFWQFGVAINGIEFHPMGLKPYTNPNDGEENWEWQQQVTEEGQTDLDAYGAHVTSQGNYHYHGDIVGLADEENGSRHSPIYGFAADGFPIYYKYGYTDENDVTSAIKELKSSYQLKSGGRPGDGTTAPDGTFDGTYIQDFEFVEGLGDLDECNGRTGVTPEYPNGTYYYVITSDFPVTPNCFVGTPDDGWKIGK